MQKELTESELKEEIIARRDAERRLRNAEESLKRLESALHESHPTASTENPTEVDKEIFTNVASLKSEFVFLQKQIRKLTAVIIYFFGGKKIPCKK